LIIEFADVKVDMVESIHISDAIDIMPEAPQSVESREVFQNQIVSEDRFAVIPEARKQIKSDVLDETPTATENIIQEFVVSEEPIEMLFDQIESADINEAPAVTEVPNEGIPETSDPAESADLIQDFIVSEVPIEILPNALLQVESVDINVPLVTELPIGVISDTSGTGEPAGTVQEFVVSEEATEIMPKTFGQVESIAQSTRTFNGISETHDADRGYEELLKYVPRSAPGNPIPLSEVFHNTQPTELRLVEDEG
jgi:hypothetical protein